MPLIGCAGREGKKMRFEMLRCAALALAAFLCAAPGGLKPVDVGPVREIAEAAMERTGSKGLAIAVIVDGRPVYIQCYGARNAAGERLEMKTIMYGASLTKAVFAYTVMQL